MAVACVKVGEIVTRFVLSWKSLGTRKGLHSLRYQYWLPDVFILQSIIQVVSHTDTPTRWLDSVCVTDVSEEGIWGMWKGLGVEH